MKGVSLMNNKFGLLVILIAAFCLLAISSVYAMGSAPPIPTEEVGVASTASEEALAKEQIDNLSNISINSKDVQESYGKFVSHVMSGKKYLDE
jgi:hypothetical protein